MDTKQIEDLLREIIAKRTAVSPDVIKTDSDLKRLGTNSMAFSYILADMENALELEMRAADVLKLKTLRDAVELVVRRKAR
jgi:acyl carrier protein